MDILLFFVPIAIIAVEYARQRPSAPAVPNSASLPHYSR